MTTVDRIYQCLLDKVSGQNGTAEKIIIGLTWTLARYQGETGLAMSPGYLTRTLPWSGELCKKPLVEVSQWIRSWNGFESSVAMSCINAALNAESEILRNATSLEGEGPGNLRVFEHFLPLIENSNVVVIGRYPGLNLIENHCKLIVLERQPGESDLPDPACEFIIPEADWVFLSATSIMNKTFPRLADLAKNANLVLMGPSLPWIEELSDFGVDYIAGIRTLDELQLESIVMEGGGTRIFDHAVEYCIYDFTDKHMEQTKKQIASTVKKRNQLKSHMNEWYLTPGRGRFPDKDQLTNLDQHLSNLDTRYKRLWDTKDQKLK